MTIDVTAYNVDRVKPAVFKFNMADSEFTEAERKRLEIINKQFSLRQKKIAQMKRRNIAVFGCLLFSVAGIYGYTLLATRQEKLDFDD